MSLSGTTHVKVCERCVCFERFAQGFWVDVGPVCFVFAICSGFLLLLLNHIGSKVAWHMKLTANVQCFQRPVRLERFKHFVDAV